jgi:hypothetical protein
MGGGRNQVHMWMGVAFKRMRKRMSVASRNVASIARRLPYSAVLLDNKVATHQGSFIRAGCTTTTGCAAARSWVTRAARSIGVASFERGGGAAPHAAACRCSRRPARLRAIECPRNGRQRPARGPTRDPRERPLRRRIVSGRMLRLRQRMPVRHKRRRVRNRGCVVCRLYPGGQQL